MSDVEPTLLAMQAAAEAVRTANHAAYDAPRTTVGIYDRTGAMHDLLVKVEQLTDDLARAAGRLAEDPHLCSTKGDDAEPRARLAQNRLHTAAQLIDTAGQAVNRAWSELSPLYLDDPAERGEAST